MCRQGKYLYSNGFRHDDLTKFDDFKLFFFLQTKLKKGSERSKIKMRKNICRITLYTKELSQAYTCILIQVT